jgi:hypothetical protein
VDRCASARLPTPGFPNLKSEVEKQDAAHEQRRREQQARQAALAARRAARFRRRRLSVVSEEGPREYQTLIPDLVLESEYLA